MMFKFEQNKTKCVYCSDIDMENRMVEPFLENYKIPEFNAEYAFRRKNIAEVYFFDKPLLIDELKWTI